MDKKKFLLDLSLTKIKHAMAEVNAWEFIYNEVARTGSCPHPVDPDCCFCYYCGDFLSKPQEPDSD